MAQADLGVRVFLIDNLTNPIGLVSSALAMMGSQLFSIADQAAAGQLNMGNLAASFYDAQAAFNAAQVGLADVANELIVAQDEVLRLSQAGPFINAAQLKQAENDLAYYEEKVQITQDKIGLLQLLPQSPQNDIRIAEAQLALERYLQKVDTTQARVQEIQDAGVIAQQVEVQEANAAVDSLIAKQGELVVASNAAETAMLEEQGAVSPLIGLMQDLGIAIGAGVDFAAFTAGLTSADQAASALTDTLNNVAIAGNLTDQQMQVMQTYLMQVANTSMYSADQVGQAFTALLEHGQSVSGVMQGIGQNAVNMAEAMGQNDATGAATLLSTAMQIFNVQAGNSRQVADMLTQAFYKGIPSTDGLTQAFLAAGGMAKAMNVPMSEFLTMMDALGQSGLSGSQAGTAFRYMLQSMYEPTQKQANELQQLYIIGVNPATDAFINLYNVLKGGDSKLPKYDGTASGLDNIFKAAQKVGEIPASATFMQWADSLGMLSHKFYDAHGNQIDFMTAFGILVTSMKEHAKSPQAFADAMAQMFNVRSGQGFADILMHVDSLSAAEKKMLESTYGAGLAAEYAGKKMDSQSKQAKALQTTFTDFLGLVGQPVQDFFKNLFHGLNDVLGKFTTGNHIVSQFFTGFLIVGAVVALISFLVIGFMALSAAAGMLDIALGPILLVVLAVAAGIALGTAAVVGLFMALQKMGFIQEFVMMFQHAFKAIQEVTGPVFDQLKAAWNELLPALKPVGAMLAGLAAIVAGVLVGALEGLASALGPILAGAVMILTGAFHVVAGVINVVVGVFKVLWFAAEMLFDFITGKPVAMLAAWHHLQAGLGQLVKGIVQIFEGFGQAVVGVFTAVFGGILAFMGGFIHGLISFFQHLADILVHHSIIPDMIKAIFFWFIQLLLLPGRIIMGLIDGFTHGISLLSGVFKNIIDAIMHVLGSMNPLQWGLNFIQMLGQGIKNGIGQLGNILGNIGGTIKHFFGFNSPAPAYPDSDQWMPNMMHMFTQGILNGTPALYSAASRASNLLHGAFTSPAANGINGSFASASASINGGNTTVPINIDGQTITTVVLNRLSGQLQMAGSGRLNR